MLIMTSYSRIEKVASCSITANIKCECVGFVVNYLFGGPRPGNWSTAASMVTDAYWGNENVVGKSNLRVKTKTALANDIIIINPSATVYVYNIKRAGWDTLNGNIGKGAGHIGVMVSANYYDKYKINNKEINGWQITMQSANWDDDGNFNNGSAWSIGGKWATLNNCTNVNTSRIFIPNGPAVSFWSRTNCDGGEGVYLYEDINYQGRCSKFTNSASRPEGWFISNNSASSIRIIGRWTATLFEHADYLGVSSYYANNDPDLRNDAIGNDRVSSIKVLRR